MNISYYNNYIISYTCLYLYIYYSSVTIYEYSLSIYIIFSNNVYHSP